MDFSVEELNLDIINKCKLFKTNDGMLAIEVATVSITTGRCIYIDYMQVIDNKVSWHPNALQDKNPKFSLSTRLKIEKILRNKVFL